MRNAFKILLALGMMTIIFFSGGCHKDDEEQLLITTDANAVNTSVSPDFNFKLIIESAMPKSGVLIEYTTKGESDNKVYYQRQIPTSNKDNQLEIINLPRQLMCICTVTVTSNTKGDNKATTSFRVGYK